MLNEVLRLTQGDLTNVIKDDKEQYETERNNKAFYDGYQGENHD